MTGGKSERSNSLTLEDMSEGGTVSNVERRRRNGLSNIFQGMSENDISALRAQSVLLDGQNSACQCCGGVDNGTTGNRTSKRSSRKRKDNLPHDKQWSRRRKALGDIFEDIPPGKINELICSNVNERTFQKLTSHLESCEFKENSTYKQRRCALADIFAGVPEEKLKELTGANDDINVNSSVTKTRHLESCPNSEDESTNTNVEDIGVQFQRVYSRRRRALGNIFADISPENVDTLVSKLF